MQRSATLINTTAAALIGVAAVFICANAQAQEAPALTLEGAAPTTATQPLPEWMKFSDPYGAKATADLSKAHLANDEIESWTQNRVTDALTFDPAGVGTKVTALRALFTDTGWASYGRLLGQMHVVEHVRTQNMTLSTIANGKASVANTSSSGGQFRWQLNLPVMQALASQAGASRTIGNHVLTVSVVRASAPTRDQAGEQPLHNDLKIDMIALASAIAPAATATITPSPQP